MKINFASRRHKILFRVRVSLWAGSDRLGCACKSFTRRPSVPRKSKFEYHTSQIGIVTTTNITAGHHSRLSSLHVNCDSAEKFSRVIFQGAKVEQ